MHEQFVLVVNDDLSDIFVAFEESDYSHVESAGLFLLGQGDDVVQEGGLRVNGKQNRVDELDYSSDLTSVLGEQGFLVVSHPDG